MKKFFSAIWDELTFVYVELKKTFSNEPSFFSSKRIERFLFVLSALWAGNYWLATHVDVLTYEMIIAYIIVWLGFAGYSMKTTEKGKENKKDDTPLDSNQDKG